MMNTLSMVLVMLPLALAAPLYAQIFGFTDRLTIVASPTFPGAGEEVQLTVRALSTDLERADIAWYKDGALIASGPALQTASVTMGALGSRTIISVTTTSDEGVLTAELILRPAEVDLLWEGTSYTPAFYEGKRFASSGSSIRAEALPRLKRADGSMVADKDIIFTWRRNDGVITQASGRGKSRATFSAPELFGTDTFSVETTSLDGALTAVESVRISSIDPFVILYHAHPLFGILYHTGFLASNSIADIEGTFAAVPYFAAATDPNDPRLRYEWRVNGRNIEPDSAEPSRLTINAENSDGKARVELFVSHATDYTMGSQGVWDVLFNSRGADATYLELFGGSE